jgi:hypothetical protein
MEATQPLKKLPQKKLKRESSRKPKLVTSLARLPSRTPSYIESSDDSSFDSDSDSDSSDEDVKEGDNPVKKAAKKRRKAKKQKKKAKKMAKKLLKKMIKKEQAKYTHSGYYEVPHNYAQLPGNNSNEKFYFVHLGKSPHFDVKDYPKWAYDMQMHLYGLHPSL